MGLKLQINSAAHQYGLDNMDVNDPLSRINTDILGEEISTNLSWSGTLLPGQSGEISQIYENGFTIKQAVENIDGSTAKVTLKSVYRTENNELLIQLIGDQIFSILNVGISLQLNTIYAGDDELNGNDYNNALRGYGGNDLIDGNAGIDTAYFSGFA